MGVKARGLAEFGRNMERLHGNFGGFLQETARALGEDLLRQARNASPVDEGTLRDSWRMRETAGGVEVENDAAHAFYVEHGHRSGGVWTAGRHFHRRCEEKMAQTAPVEVRRRLEEILKEAT